MRWVSSHYRFVEATAVKMEQRILAELADLESQAQLRHLETVHGIDLGSNDYLGLSTDPRMKQAIRDALDSSSRVASTGSRLLSGHDELWTTVENNFARWVGAEAALYFTSGYAANIGLLSAILRPEDAVFSDSANHASLIDGIRLAKCKRVIFPHLDLNALEAELRWTLSGSGARFIVVESIFSMDGDRAPLRISHRSRRAMTQTSSWMKRMPPACAAPAAAVASRRRGWPAACSLPSILAARRLPPPEHSCVVRRRCAVF